MQTSLLYSKFITGRFNVKLPFEIEENFSVFGIEQMIEHQIDIMDEMIQKIFVEVTPKGELMYVLDWQHNAFLYDPRKEEENRGYFPSFYPDGDYSFFIHESFEFGYLADPWRQEIWVFGDNLISKMEKIYKNLGWKKIK